MRVPAITFAFMVAAAPAFAVQVVVGGTQSAVGFPFYGC
jgi:hypothetical protein